MRCQGPCSSRSGARNCKPRKGHCIQRFAKTGPASQTFRLAPVEPAHWQTYASTVSEVSVAQLTAFQALGAAGRLLPSSLDARLREVSICPVVRCSCGSCRDTDASGQRRGESHLVLLSDCRNGTESTRERKRESESESESERKAKASSTPVTSSSYASSQTSLRTFRVRLGSRGAARSPPARQLSRLSSARPGSDHAGVIWSPSALATRKLLPAASALRLAVACFSNILRAEISCGLETESAVISSTTSLALALAPSDLITKLRH